MVLQLVLEPSKRASAFALSALFYGTTIATGSPLAGTLILWIWTHWEMLFLRCPRQSVSEQIISVLFWSFYRARLSYSRGTEAANIHLGYSRSLQNEPESPAWTLQHSLQACMYTAFCPGEFVLTCCLTTGWSTFRLAENKGQHLTFRLGSFLMLGI